MLEIVVMFLMLAVPEGELEIDTHLEDVTVLEEAKVADTDSVAVCDTHTDTEKLRVEVMERELEIVPDFVEKKLAVALLVNEREVVALVVCNVECIIANKRNKMNILGVGGATSLEEEEFLAESTRIILRNCFNTFV